MDSSGTSAAFEVQGQSGCVMCLLLVLLTYTHTHHITVSHERYGSNGEKVWDVCSSVTDTPSVSQPGVELLPPFSTVDLVRLQLLFTIIVLQFIY